MGINRMTGTSWHVEKVHRKDGDLRRSKKRYKYYEDGSCDIYIRCIGSAHCRKYIEKEDDDSKRKSLKIKNNTNLINKKNKKEVVVLIEFINSVEAKIFNSLKEKGNFKFRGFFERFIKYCNYNEFDIKRVFIRMSNGIYLCESKI